MIYNEDCITSLDLRFDSRMIDLTITSPPYNVGINYDAYNDNRPYDEYISWLKTIFSRIYDKTVDGGRCAINIGDGKNGSIAKHSHIISMMGEIGWLTKSTIIWQKNHSSLNTSWGTFNSPLNPSFVTTFEYILIFCKQSYKLCTNGITDLTKSEFTQWSRAIWNISGKRDVDHPASFPVIIPYRLIKMLTWTDSLIYDPFAGVGTVGVASKQLNREFIGSEISAVYSEIGNQRIINEPIFINNNNKSYF